MAETMLDYLRIGIYTLIIILGFFLVQAWEKDHPATVAAATQTENLPAEHYAPAVTQVSSPSVSAVGQAASPTIPASAQGEVVNVKTDVLDVNIDTRGGDIIGSKLLKFPVSLNSTTPFVLLNDDPKTRYIAESGLLSPQGPDTSNNQALYTVSQPSFTLGQNENDLIVRLNWQNKEGLHVTKIYTFVRNSYEIDVQYEIENQTKSPWQGNIYTQLMRTDSPPPTQGGMINLTTFFGAALSTPAKPFEKITFKDMHEQNLAQSSKDGWAAMIQHYFISAWIPGKDVTSNYYTRVLPNGLYTIGMIQKPIVVAPGQKLTTEPAKLYTGPAITSKLEQAAPNLKLTIDYGWFWFISVIIFWMMQKIYDVVGNWGWAIVIVTVIIKLLFYHLSAKSFRSMSAMKKLQPKIEMLKERFGDDKQKFTQATLELYRQEKVNPMSGCLPILVQIPVFIALYWVLVESVELRQAPFILWIHDLSQHDPYYILPLLMGASMFIQQRLSPPPPDPIQAKVMMMMPIVFTFLFANFPAGLMLYWFVNNTLSVLQQWFIMHSMEKETKRD